MPGLKPSSPVTNFFKTTMLLTDQVIADWLSEAGIKVVPCGNGGYPTEGVFHTDDLLSTWVGSRLDGYNGRVLAFFSKREDDPIFAAVRAFAPEITGAELVELKSTLAIAQLTRDERERVERISRTKKDRAAEARREAFPI